MKRLILVMCILSFAPTGLAQAPVTGFPQYGSFQRSDLDAVNLQNLNVNFSIPTIAAVPGRTGSGLQLTKVYNTHSYDIGMNDLYGYLWEYAGGGWEQTDLPLGTIDANVSYYSDICDSYGNPYNEDRYTNWVYTEPSGTAHLFSNVSLIFIVDDCSTDTYRYSGTLSGFSPEGYYIAISVTDVVNRKYDLVVKSPSGTQIFFPDQQNDPGLGGGNTNLKDANGNQITSNLGPPPTRYGQYWDTANRNVITVSAGSDPGSEYSYTDAGGTLRKYILRTQGYQVKTAFGCNGIREFNQDGTYGLIQLASEIELPNGKKYQFFYEDTPGSPGFVTGRLSRVITPTGATYTYAYGDASNHYGIDCSDGSATNLTRTISDGIVTSQWTYVRQGSSPNWATTVTDPLVNDTVYTFDSTTKETRREIYQGTGPGRTLQRTVVTTRAPNTSPATATVILEDGTQSEAETTYDDFGNLLVHKEHDWGPGAPGPIIRSTTFDYLSTTPYTDRNIRNRVTSMIVHQGDVTGPIKARTDIAYDEAAYSNVACPAGVPQHDDTYDCTLFVRGNPTTVTKYTDAATPSGAIAQHTSYDSLGNVRSTIEPLGQTTSFDYTDNFTDGINHSSYAYVTAVTYPSTNGVSHVERKQYYWNTGSLAASCGQNFPAASPCANTYSPPQPDYASYTYDLLGRQLTTTLGDGGQTTLTYDDTALSATTTAKMTASQNIVSTLLLDGLGRNRHQQLNSDPEGIVYLDTTYDALGRVVSVSNPYRSTSNPTDGTTTTQYDALDRVTKAIPPDGTSTANNISIGYSGNCTTVTDQAGKSRKSCSDALGRLTQVFEDPAGANYETDYTYDVLGNVLTVNQKGGSTDQNQWRTRTFTYDSISRLVCASNPENSSVACPATPGAYTLGTTGYAYDANGNVLTKTAPAPNQTGSATVTTTYSYDALNRLTGDTYNDGSTPVANFQYDQTSIDGANPQNPIGRLTKAISAGGYADTIFSYDPMGRIKQEWQCTPYNCGTGSFYLSFGYDLAGDMTSYTNGTFVTFTQTFDTAGRVTGLTSNFIDDQHPATLATVDSNAGYYPNGGIHKMNTGNGLTQTAVFDKRLQLCRINVNSSNSALGTCMDPVPSSGNLQDFNYGFNLGSSDNGNVMGWSATGQQSFNRTYGYDALNRLNTLSSPSDPGGCNGLTWSYDAWGNRTAQTTTGGSCFQQPLTTYSAKNQLPTPYGYDAAGNMTNDGSHTYYYDAENRVIQVDGTLGTCSIATVCYTYDALGRRVEKITGTAKRDYIYDLSDRVITEWCINCGGFTGWVIGYNYFNGVLNSEYENASTYFAHTDHLGSTHLLTGVGQSQVSNGSFEQGLTGWTSSNALLVTDPTRAHSGNNYVQLSAPAQGVAAVYSPLVAVQPGDQITFGGWAYLESGAGGAPGWWLAVFDATQTAFAYIGTPNSASSTWTFQSATYTVPSNGAFVQLYAQVYQPTASTVLRVDDGFLYNSRLSLTIVGNLDYLPFGELNSSDSGTTSHKFTGFERDSETGLDHTMFRQYSSFQGRWSLPDPLGIDATDLSDPQSLNLYAYAGNNPLVYIDPLGLDYNVCITEGENSTYAGCTTVTDWEELRSLVEDSNAILIGDWDFGKIFVSYSDYLENHFIGDYYYFNGDGGGTSSSIKPPIMEPDQDPSTSGSSSGGSVLRAPTDAERVTLLQSKQLGCFGIAAKEAIGEIVLKKEIEATANVLLGDSNAVQGAVTPGSVVWGAAEGLKHVAGNRPLLITIRGALREEGHRVSANALARGARFGGKFAFFAHVGLAAEEGREAYQACMAY